MSGLKIEGDAKLRTLVRLVSRWGTLCGVFAMLPMILGCPTGTPCTTAADCDDGDACTTDTCGADGFCVSSDVVCGTGEECVDGTCVATCTAAGDCDDGNVCTDDDCVNGFCESTDNTAACDDGNVCTDNDACAGGTCAGTAIAGCCTSNANCAAGETCDTTTNTCQAAPPACTVDADCPDDGNACTTETCDAGACVSTNNTDPCDDGNSCTTGDTCADGACSGTPVSCPSGRTCNPANGNCEEITCTSNADCDDGASCTTDTCQLSTGECVYTAVDAACDDGLFCNGDEGIGSCDPSDADAEAGTGCVRPGDPCGADTPICNEATNECDPCGSDADCDDGASCTTDNCENDGSCTNTPNDAVCDDDLFCTDDDFCEPDHPDADETTGCVNETDPCDCNHPSNPCGFTAAGFFEQRKICNELGGGDGECVDCQANADCNDGITCTADTCDGGSGVCTNQSDDDRCPDPSFCDGVDFCDPNSDDADANGCVQPGNPCDNPDPICSESQDDCFGCTSNAECSEWDGEDDVLCTDTTCDGSTGACDNTPNDDNCDAGEVCDEFDDCVPNLD